MIDSSGIGNHILKDHSITCVKTRILSRSQHLLRIDREAKYDLTKEMLSHIKKIIFKINPSFIIISDYNKGMINKELLNILKNSFPDIKILVDPKGLDWDKYGGPYLIKPNLSEIHTVVEVKDPLTDEGISKIQAYRSSISCEHLLITLSSKGMLLLNDQGHQLFDVDPAEVYDVTGAGDTAIAALVFGLSLGKSLKESIVLANQASRFVVTKPKTYAIKSDDLKI
jgi:D-beta-D-heptose 7-phosphate kinase/D-beta-D-heptose 1-phosphate adenosyltransferase